MIFISLVNNRCRWTHQRLKVLIFIKTSGNTGLQSFIQIELFPTAINTGLVVPYDDISGIAKDGTCTIWSVESNITTHSKLTRISIESAFTLTVV